MAAPLSNESYQLLKLLRDGQWRPYTEFLDALAATVAPGRALRTWESREAGRTNKGVRVGPPPPEEEKIRMGARTLAHQAVKGMRDNWLEFEYFNNVKHVRRRPVPGRRAADIPPELELLPPGGVGVVSGEEIKPGVEEGPDRQADPDDDQGEALVSEDVFRGIVADVVRGVVQEELATLSRLQKAWFSDRFAHVEALILQQSPRLQSVMMEELARLRSPFGLASPPGEGRRKKRH